jgi:hypothetical protein
MTVLRLSHSFAGGLWILYLCLCFQENFSCTQLCPQLCSSVLGPSELAEWKVCMQNQAGEPTLATCQQILLCNYAANLSALKRPPPPPPTTTTTIPTTITNHHHHHQQLPSPTTITNHYYFSCCCSSSLIAVKESRKLGVTVFPRPCGPSSMKIM